MIKMKGGAGFAVGLAIPEVIQAIALDSQAILPVGSLVNGVYGIRDVASRCPPSSAASGVEAQHEIELWPKEISALAALGPGAAANDRPGAEEEPRRGEVGVRGRPVRSRRRTARRHGDDGVGRACGVGGSRE